MYGIFTDIDLPNKNPNCSVNGQIYGTRDMDPSNGLLELSKGATLEAWTIFQELVTALR